MLIYEIIKSIILGFVQGISEWLPISSTGHMILADEFIQMNMSTQFMEMYMVVIQLASVFAVILLYFRKLNPFDGQKSPAEQSLTINIWKKVIVGVIPAAVIGLLFDDIITELFYGWQTVSVTLIFYGIAFIVVEHLNKGKDPKFKSWDDLTYQVALIIGFFQVLALIPGTSRSGATIIGAILIGTARPIAAEYSFFLSIPVMFGASFLKLFNFGFAFTPAELVVLIVGCIVSFVVSIVAIKFLMNYIKRNDFTAFGWYRIILGAIVILYFTLIGS